MLTEAYYSNVSTEKDVWVFDTAASHHFCNFKKFYSDFSPVTENLSLDAPGITYLIKGTGTVILYFNDICRKFRNILCAPNLKKNLISGPQLDRKDFKYIGKKGKVRVSLDNKILFTATLKNGIYYLHPDYLKQKFSKKVTFEASNTQMINWHRKLARVSSDLIINTYKHKGVRGLPDLKKGGFFFLCV